MKLVAEDERNQVVAAVQLGLRGVAAMKLVAEDERNAREEHPGVVLSLPPQ